MRGTIQRFMLGALAIASTAVFHHVHKQRPQSSPYELLDLSDYSVDIDDDEFSDSSSYFSPPVFSDGFDPFDHFHDFDSDSDTSGDSKDSHLRGHDPTQSTHVPPAEAHNLTHATTNGAHEEAVVAAQIDSINKDAEASSADHKTGNENRDKEKAPLITDGTQLDSTQEETQIDPSHPDTVLNKNENDQTEDKLIQVASTTDASLNLAAEEPIVSIPSSASESSNSAHSSDLPRVNDPEKEAVLGRIREEIAAYKSPQLPETGSPATPNSVVDDINTLSGEGEDGSEVNTIPAQTKELQMPRRVSVSYDDLIQLVSDKLKQLDLEIRDKGRVARTRKLVAQNKLKEAEAARNSLFIQIFKCLVNAWGKHPAISLAMRPHERELEAKTILQRVFKVSKSNKEAVKMISIHKRIQSQFLIVNDLEDQIPKNQYIKASKKPKPSGTTRVAHTPVAINPPRQAQVSSRHAGTSVQTQHISPQANVKIPEFPAIKIKIGASKGFFEYDLDNPVHAAEIDGSTFYAYEVQEIPSILTIPDSRILTLYPTSPGDSVRKLQLRGITKVNSRKKALVYDEIKQADMLLISVRDLLKEYVDHLTFLQQYPLETQVELVKRLGDRAQQDNAVLKYTIVQYIATALEINPTMLSDPRELERAAEIIFERTYGPNIEPKYDWKTLAEGIVNKQMAEPSFQRRMQDVKALIKVEEEHFLNAAESKEKTMKMVLRKARKMRREGNYVKAKVLLAIYAAILQKEVLSNQESKVTAVAGRILTKNPF